MSITSELREYAGSFYLFRYKDVREKLDAIADRIDAEHEAKVSYWQGTSYKDGYDEGFASADDWLGQHEDAMAEHGWVRLPVDADGVPIHVGDWITGRWDAKAKVVAVTSDDVYWWEPDGCHWCHAFEVRHYHAPTVEDVLREFGKAWVEWVDGSPHDPIAEYAKKLQLKEGA